MKQDQAVRSLIAVVGPLLLTEAMPVARLASVAQGSDGGGSIRIPASVTGLVGIKPARGRVTMAPNVDSVGELGVVGPLARTVADAAALLDVLAGSRPGDPFAQPDAEAGSFLAAARRSPDAMVEVARLLIARSRSAGAVWSG